MLGGPPLRERRQPFLHFLEVMKDNTFSCFAWAFSQWGTMNIWWDSEVWQCWNQWAFSPAHGTLMFHEAQMEVSQRWLRVVYNISVLGCFSLCVVSMFPVTMEDVVKEVYFLVMKLDTENLRCSCKFLHSVMQLELATKYSFKYVVHKVFAEFYNGKPKWPSGRTRSLLRSQ